MVFGNAGPDPYGSQHLLNRGQTLGLGGYGLYEPHGKGHKPS